MTKHNIDILAVLCEGPLSLEELTISVRQLKTGKAPGLNGLPVEFDRAFWIASKTTLFKWLMTSTSRDLCHQVKERVLLDYFTRVEIARASSTGGLSVF